eukprot:scaffold6387_cov171-Amphora_coffeaeformis.AAC.1
MKITIAALFIALLMPLDGTVAQDGIAITQDRVSHLQRALELASAKTPASSLDAFESILQTWKGQIVDDNTEGRLLSEAEGE